VFTFADIDELLEAKRLEWDLPTTLSNTKFLILLQEHALLKKTSINFPHREYSLYAYSGVLRPPFPVNFGHPFRLTSATYSGHFDQS
ncbi:MAG: hypothetical protein KJ793_04070, partial [Candidatus Omnitrophica bacterium]|nr:hypothetical protein [Candidatus Omnitrophota bacterium]